MSTVFEGIQVAYTYTLYITNPHNGLHTNKRSAHKSLERTEFYFAKFGDCFHEWNKLFLNDLKYTHTHGRHDGRRNNIDHLQSVGRTKQNRIFND